MDTNMDGNVSLRCRAALVHWFVRAARNRYPRGSFPLAAPGHLIPSGGPVARFAVVPGRRRQVRIASGAWRTA